MKDSAATFLRFAVVRLLERRLSVDGLYRALQPMAFVRAAFAARSRRRVKSPDCFDSSRHVPPGEQRQMDPLNDVLEFLPDQLGTAKWIGRCQFSGLDRLQQARRSGRPIVLAFCHSGPYHLLRFWLRAAGFPAATFLKGTSEHRKRFRRRQDQLSSSPEFPVAFYQDQLREAIEFLAAGNTLLIALDGRAGKQMEVPVRDNWNFEMATGPVRLAARSQAELFPCCIVDQGRWRFRIELGSPVPGEFLADDTGGIRAGEHLIRELFPHFEARPEQCKERLLERFRQIETAGNVAEHANA